jgi:hypothetical protein
MGHARRLAEITLRIPDAEHFARLASPITTGTALFVIFKNSSSSTGACVGVWLSKIRSRSNEVVVPIAEGSTRERLKVDLPLLRTSLRRKDLDTAVGPVDLTRVTSLPFQQMIRIRGGRGRTFIRASNSGFTQAPSASRRYPRKLYVCHRQLFRMPHGRYDGRIRQAHNRSPRCLVDNSPMVSTAPRLAHLSGVATAPWSGMPVPWSATAIPWPEQRRSWQ